VSATCPYSEPTTQFLKIHFNILILSFHHLGFPSGLFPSLRFSHQNLVYNSLSPKHATCPGQLILLDLITRTIFGEDYRPLSSSLCVILHTPVTSSLSGPYILKQPQPTFLLKVCDQVSQPYKTTSKITVFYFG